MLEAIRIASNRKATQYQARQKDYLSSPVVDRHASVLTLVPNVVTGMPFKKSLQDMTYVKLLCQLCKSKPKTRLIESDGSGEKYLKF